MIVYIIPRCCLECHFFTQLANTLGLSFSSTDELNNIINKKLPNGLPKFVQDEVTLAGQTYEFYHRDIQCIHVLYGNPEIAEFLAHAPEKHFTGQDQKTHVYSEMHSGKWWWTCQVCLQVFSSEFVYLIPYGIEGVSRGDNHPNPYLP